MPLVKAFFSVSPTVIRYANQPPSMNPEIQSLTPQEVGQKLGFTWTDSIMVDASQRHVLWEKAGDPVRNTKTELDARTMDPLESLVLCKINDQIGHGVFLDRDAQPIPIGTVVGIYAGKLVEQRLYYGTDPEYQPYVMAANLKEQAGSPLNQFFKHAEVDADENGNITRFFQDLPLQHELDGVVSDNLVRSNIFTANLLVCPALLYGCPVNYFVTARVIQPGEQLGFCYEFKEWPFARCLFNKNGEIIGTLNNGKFTQRPDWLPSEQDRTPQNIMGDMKKHVAPVLRSISTQPVFYKTELLQRALDFVIAICEPDKANLRIVKELKKIKEIKDPVAMGAQLNRFLIKPPISLPPDLKNELEFYYRRFVELAMPLVKSMKVKFSAGEFDAHYQNPYCGKTQQSEYNSVAVRCRNVTQLEPNNWATFFKLIPKTSVVSPDLCWLHGVDEPKVANSKEINTALTSKPL